MVFVNLIVTVLGISIIVLGILLRQQKAKWMITEYSKLTEEEKEAFESEHDSDKYWKFMGNMMILVGIIVLVGGIGYFIDTYIFGIIIVITVIMFVYFCYISVVKNQYKIRK